MNEVGGVVRSATGNFFFRRNRRGESPVSLAHVAAMRRKRLATRTWGLREAVAPELNAAMSFHFQFRRYRLALRVPVRTAHEVWSERQGILLRIQRQQGGHGFGEIAPIPAFGTESIEEAEAGCRAVGEWPSEAVLRSIPAPLGCVRGAVASALSACDEEAETADDVGDVQAYRAVAALVPAGRAAIDAIKARGEAGFRVFKWKVGAGDVADELALLDDVCAALPSGARLRLDANGAWDRRHAERWLERCADRPVEYLEQPCFVAASVDRAAARRADDTLLGLASDFPTPIALDESVVRSADVERWIGMGWRGWFVVKPTLMDDLAAALSLLDRASATVVFSSALETAVGAQAALRTAFKWSREPKALGFGVWPLFTNLQFDGPAAAPFIQLGDVSRIDPEVLWNALA